VKSDGLRAGSAGSRAHPAGRLMGRTLCGPYRRANGAVRGRGAQRAEAVLRAKHQQAPPTHRRCGVGSESERRHRCASAMRGKTHLGHFAGIGWTALLAVLA